MEGYGPHDGGTDAHTIKIQFVITDVAPSNPVMNVITSYSIHYTKLYENGNTATK